MAGDEGGHRVPRQSRRDDRGQRRHVVGQVHHIHIARLGGGPVALVQRAVEEALGDHTEYRCQARGCELPRPVQCDGDELGTGIVVGDGIARIVDHREVRA
jgi:hypothetical protein